MLLNVYYTAKLDTNLKGDAQKAYEPLKKTVIQDYLQLEREVRPKQFSGNREKRGRSRTSNLEDL